MSDLRAVGVRPWFPWPLSRWNWWNEQIPAERVAALRVATALVLLIDIGLGYAPHFTKFFSPDAVGDHLYESRFRADHAYWSALRWLPEAWGAQALFAVWVASAVALLVGWRPLLSGLAAWACAVSVWNFNPGLHNSGDRLRHTLFLMTAVSCSGAVWGVSSLRSRTDPRPIVVPGWPVKVLFVQLACLYFFSGYYKVLSPVWRSGYVMYWTSHDLGWSMCPGTANQVPVWAHRLSALVTLGWELGFPALAVWRLTRVPTLALGVLFHLGTLLTLEVGAFALYSIACYTAFVPWERLRDRRRIVAPSDAGP
ncbi:HTTM domain-containing protein [Gemmata sp. JC673]|uniref:HTTM domain-containing protein n=1 Tax=Gemmata algarum TaxID=2975278 RepID=A0ABU5F8I3_9BACT|nr:HTTM domain-containing protein [Gemmata algarum]MDY3563799.1 HTTM domain-containing protein [Gemmata algarum]